MTSHAPAAGQIRILSGMADISRADWDACANPGWNDAVGQPEQEGERTPFNPFISWDFLHCLEESGAVGARTGWAPRHLLLDGADGAPAGVMPCYLKSHSQGEYVFDWGWADAFERAGGRYYPKLQVSVPFTPVTGRRLLARPGPNEETSRKMLVAGLVELTRRYDASSAHLTFLPRDEWELLGGMGFLCRTDQQFHWTDQGYGSFDGFLAALASRKRKALRKERREALSAGITVEWITGPALTEAHWDQFFAFYTDTGSRKWGQPYLNRRFFSLLGERMADRVLLITAKRDGRYVAGALNLIGSDTLYGRYWGCLEEHPFLHFEICYYQAIDFALAHGLRRVEAGAQGEHKLARGYLPQLTYSAHHIADPGFRRAVDDYLQRERQQVAIANAVLAEHAPFRSEGREQGVKQAEHDSQRWEMPVAESVYDDQNVFAKILRGDIPAHQVYDDEHVVAIMDVMPQGDGHVLILPRAPSRNLLDIGAHDLQNVILAVQRLARAVVRAFDAQGVTVMQFNEAAGGQSVFHTHFHVIPRFEGKPLTGHTGKKADGAALAEQAFRIRAVLGGAA